MALNHFGARQYAAKHFVAIAHPSASVAVPESQGGTAVGFSVWPDHRIKQQRRRKQIAVLLTTNGM